MGAAEVPAAGAHAGSASASASASVNSDSAGGGDDDDDEGGWVMARVAPDHPAFGDGDGGGGSGGAAEADRLLLLRIDGLELSAAALRAPAVGGAALAVAHALLEDLTDAAAQCTAAVPAGCVCFRVCVGVCVRCSCLSSHVPFAPVPHVHALTPNTLFPLPPSLQTAPGCCALATPPPTAC